MPIPPAWLLCSLLIAALVTTPLPAADAPPDPIATAISQLSDPNASIRERASRLLWQSGRAAEAQLEAASKGPDPEISARCSEILAAIREGIPLGLPASVVDLVRDYRKGDAQ